MPSTSAAIRRRPTRTNSLSRRARGDDIPDGRRPGDPAHLPTGPLWQAHPTFSEYFNGDTGAGLGASHQTGWTAMVADLICSGHPTDPTTKDATS